MSNHSDLNAYIARLQQRLRLAAWQSTIFAPPT